MLQTQNAAIEPAIETLRADPSVDYVQPNYIAEIQLVPNDPLFNQQWAHTVASTVEAWDIGRGNPAVIVAILDTGVDYSHEDLAANIAPNGYDVVDIDLTQWENDGFTPLVGEDYTTPDSDPMDFNGHGTHCAGIVAAVADNGKGVSGVAPLVKIMPVRAGFEIAAGSDRYAYLESDDIAAGIIYAVDHGADVISMSFGMSEQVQVISDAISYAREQGVVLVAAAGNSSSAYPFYPAALPGVLAIGATNQYGGPAWYTNRGFWVDLAAPGGDSYLDSQILCTVPKAGGQLSDPTGYRSLSGTSMACPYAAGVAALLISKNPAWTADNIATIMKQSADPVSGSKYVGEGRINALKAMQTVAVPDVAITISDPTQGANFRTGSINVWATITGSTNYTIEYGAGLYPASWTSFASGSAPAGNSLLGTLDITGFAAGTYTLRVSGFVGSDRVLETVRINIDPSLRAGWPQQAPVYPRSAYLLGWSNAPSIADVNNDGKADILVLADISASAFSENGSFLPGWPLPSEQGSTNGQTPSIGAADLDNNGTTEVVVSEYSQFRVFNSIGQVTAGTAWGFSSNYLMQPLLADLDGDGQKEIIQKMWLNSDPTTGGVSVFSANGAPFLNWPAQVGTDYTANLEYGNLTALDIDQDGRKEIITLHNSATTGRPTIFVWNYDGSLRSGYPKDTDLGPIDITDHPTGGPLVADIDNDGVYEIGFMLNNGGCGSSFGRYVYVHLDGTVLPGWPAPFFDQGMRDSTSVADLDNDGQLETVITTTGERCGPYFTPAINVLGSDGASRPNWPQRLPEGDAWGQAALIDLDGDGQKDIVVGTTRGELHAWSAAGVPLVGFPKRLGVMQAEPTDVRSCPAVGDIDGDGYSEIVATSTSGAVYAWDLPAPYVPDAADWRMFQADALHSAMATEVVAAPWGTFEAENLTRTTAPIGSNIATAQAGASNSAYVQFNPGAKINDWIQFTLPNIPAGVYKITAYYKSKNNRGIVRATVDGANQGASFDEYSVAEDFQVPANLGIRALTAGNHFIRFTLTGKNADSRGYTMTIDKIVLKPVVAYSLEAENLSRTANVTTTIETNAQFSDGRAVKITGTGIGSYVKFDLPNIAAGTYKIQVYYKSNNNRPIVQTKLDGVNQSGTKDMYTANAAYGVIANLGNKTWTSSGNKTLKITVTGKNRSSTGYTMHIDKIVLASQ